MQAHKPLGLRLSVVLLSLVWPAASNLASRPHPILAVALAVTGASLFAASGASASTISAPARDSGSEPASRRLFFSSLAEAAIILAVSGLSSYALTAIAWRFHDINAVVPGLLLRLLGVGSLNASSLNASLLAVWTGTHSEVVRLTCEGLGLYQVWFLLVTLAAFSWLSPPASSWRSRCRAAMVALSILAVYAVFRFAGLVVLATEFAKPWLLWREPYATISWLPLALVLRIPGRPGASLLATRGLWTAPRAELRHLGPAILFVAGLGLAFAAWFNDPGHAKRGRLLIDESHSNWEWTDEPFDTTSFGIRAEYNYSCLREYLSHFYEVKVSDSAIAGALDSADVLIIKTPTAAYTGLEVEAIERFVRRGGGLLLIGDHTNLFGMSTYLNCIASRFGMRFRFDDTFDLETTGLSTYRRPRFAFHPAARRIGLVGFLTSCSIEGGLGVEPVIVGCGLGSEDVDYGHPNFFSNINCELADRFGLFLQAGATRHGAGRVLLFTDSTCFSNFCMFSPGKPEMILGFIDYLNRRGTRCPYVRLGALGLGLAGTLVGFGVANRSMRVGVPYLGLAIVAGFALGTFATARLNAKVYGPIRERVPLPAVLFDTDHSGASFFTYLGEAPDRRSQQFAEFFMCVQRVGLYPRHGSIRDIGDSAPRAVVIVNPVRAFSDQELTEFATYVSGGGHLLLLDTIENSVSSANQVLGRFGMRMMTAAIGVETIEAPSSREIHPALVLLGSGITPGRSDMRPAYFIKGFGKGKVAVCVNSFRYSASVVGTPLDRGRPTQAVLRIYAEIFTLLRDVVSEAPGQ
jgi:hypothetical protein